MSEIKMMHVNPERAKHQSVIYTTADGKFKYQLDKAVNPIPRLRLRLGLGPLQRPVAGKDKALCLNGVQRALRHFAGGFHIGVNQGLQHGFHTVGHFLLLFRGQLGKHTVGGGLLGGLFHSRLHRLLYGLLRLPLLLKL